MRRMTDLTLTCRRVIKAAPELVYNAWLDPAVMTRFMSPGPDMHVSEARSDPRVGGRFFVLMQGDKPYPHEGSYLELVPHSRIVFTWEAPWSAPGTQVELVMTPVAEGTEVVLTHVKFMSEEARDNHFAGWTGILEKLAASLSGKA
ncbi:MAG: SRPBCC domain-containing protein [Rhodobacter sp.]|nr:SRPBCC domain-containing protein [Rhodobacter sp.]